MIITFYVLGNLLIIYLGSVSVAATRLVPVITGGMWVDFLFQHALMHDITLIYDA